jgi:hypothetical protein
LKLVVGVAPKIVVEDACVRKEEQKRGQASFYIRKKHEYSVNGTGTLECVKKSSIVISTAEVGLDLVDLGVRSREVGDVVISATGVGPANSIGKESSRRGKQPSSSSCGEPTSGPSLPQPSRDLK